MPKSESRLKSWHSIGGTAREVQRGRLERTPCSWSKAERSAAQRPGPGWKERSAAFQGVVASEGRVGWALVPLPSHPIPKLTANE